MIDLCMIRLWDKACKCYYYPDKDRNVKIHDNLSVSIADVWATRDIIFERKCPNRDIYDGDIIECDGFDGQYRLLFVKGMGGEAFVCINMNDEDKGFLLEKDLEIKKVGNIHEEKEEL